MKTFLNSKFFYVLFPIYFSLALVLAFFNVPSGFYPSLLSLFSIITGVFILFSLFFPGKMEIDESYRLVVMGQRHRQFVIVMCLGILISGPFDILVNGFKLLNPLSYAEFNGIGRYIRHISSLCWALVPISFIFIRSRKVRVFLILYAIIFPILIIDRNRLFMSFYSLIFCVALAPLSPGAALRAKRSRTKHILLLLLVLSSIFSLLGLFRSGDSFIVESSGKFLVSGAFPLRGVFFQLPILLQQIVLYISTPTFNFATIVFYGFRNSEFLISQFSPFSRDEAYQYAPVMIERFNVGTEFYPWLLYGGLPWVLFSFALLLLTFFLSIKLVRSFPNIFSLLIFLKISYAALFMGFGPQFYILLNLVFILLMLVLWTCSSALRSVTMRNNVEFSGKLQ